MTTSAFAEAGVRTRPEGLPKLTLFPEIMAWGKRIILQPDGPDAGSPFKLTPEQEHFLLWWYAVDSAGRFVYRRGMLRRMKGWGKDPLGAYICAVELVGPSRFDHFDATGWPRAKAHDAAWVQTAAVSREQTKNTMTLFPGMLSQTFIDRYKVDIGKEIIYANRGKQRIEAVTSSPRSLEGARSTFVLKNETHLWFGPNEGHEMANVIARNLAKSRDGSARSLAISNAHEPGADSDAEHDFEAYEKIRTGKSRATGFLYDNLEAPPDTDIYDPESLRAGLIAARGDSVWLDVDRLIEEIYDPNTKVSNARRFYLNHITATEDAWVSRQEWDACTAPRKLIPGEEITLGLDGSKSDDHTILTACAISDSHLVPLAIFEPSKYASGVVPLRDVDSMVRRAFEVYDVVGFLSDVKELESYIDLWEEQLGDDLCVRSNAHHAIAFDMRQRKREATMAIEALYDAIIERQCSHDGDAATSQYVYNARRAPNPFGISIRKENPSSDKKIDFTVTAALARKARQDYLLLPDNKKRRRKGLSVFIPGDDE